MDFQDIQYWMQDYAPLILLLALLLLPTALHFLLLSYGYTSPSILQKVAITNWFKGVIGIVAGIFFGYLVTRKWG